uniref:Junctional adhesion molecule A n=1 Tax=Leptobrachium leishanense TaxID=445787 RepID=A0A8C5R816_9ANUR
MRDGYCKQPIPRAPGCRCGGVKVRLVMSRGGGASCLFVLSFGETRNKKDMESKWLILGWMCCGLTAEFSCEYSANFQTPRVEWKFADVNQDAKIIFYEDTVTDSYKDRVVVFPRGLRLSGVSGTSDNGVYTCEVTAKDSSGQPLYLEAKTKLTVLVPPSTPVAQVPTSPTNGGVAILYCIEKSSSPPATFTWFKNQIQMPPNPKDSPTFQNSSYTIDPNSGVLKFEPVTKVDSGEYYCEAKNSQGAQTSAAVRMETHEVNVGGIVAAVIVSLLILALIAFGVWFAYSRGYFGKKTNKKVIYSQPSETRSDRNFQQTSSFLV